MNAIQEQAPTACSAHENTLKKDDARMSEGTHTHKHTHKIGSCEIKYNQRK